ncbi:hypothetical protein MKZ38_009107 [Zalerion maritima]|uniref:FAD-binding PCMH-type domain-containing protein n=1 Tax=Zalerion maritima TaxID=339359 RepID=A0AAD5S1Y8_9PEZI|nr:hypothetical protein MKZ38_009107 [Zalerion maritima]
MAISCPIIRPSDPSFMDAAWSRVFNKRRDATDAARKPHAVAKPRSAAELVEAVDLAVSEGARISVRSGGHSWAAWSVRSKAVILDLADFNEIDYDEKTHVVKVTSRVTGRMLNGFLKPKGRLFPGGHCPDVGVGGFLLQGGMGWVCKSWGWACEHVAAVDVITADGRQLYCDEKENSDLFFAARGAGPGFPAVVVRFHLKTLPLLQMYKNTYIYPLSEYKKVLQWTIEQARAPNVDGDLEAVCLSTSPPGFDSHICLSAFTVFKKTEEEAQAVLGAIHKTRPDGPMVDKCCELSSLDSEYDDQGAANPENHRYSSENAYIKNDADVPAVLEKAFTTMPHKKAFALYYAMAPTSRRWDPALPGPDKGQPGLARWPDMALSMQSDHYFALYTVWENEDLDEKCKGWNKMVMDEIKDHSVGSYLGDSDFRYRTTKFWDDGQAKRLKEVREKWDPEGVFAGYLELEDEVAAEATNGRRRDVGKVILNQHE